MLSKSQIGGCIKELITFIIIPPASAVSQILMEL